MIFIWFSLYNAPLKGPNPNLLRTFEFEETVSVIYKVDPLYIAGNCFEHLSLIQQCKIKNTGSWYTHEEKGGLIKGKRHCNTCLHKNSGNGECISKI